MATSTDDHELNPASAALNGRRRFRQRIKDLPVGRKLFGGFAALMAVLSLVVVCLFVAINQLGSANSQIVEVTAGRARWAAELRFSAASMHDAQQGYVLADTPSHESFDQAASRFENALAELQADSATPAERALLRKISTGYQTFIVTDQIIWDAVHQGRPQLARRLAIGPEKLSFDFLSADAVLLSELAEMDRVAAVDGFEQAADTAKRLAGLLAAAGIAVMLLASGAIARLIRDPLQRVQQAAERAADGDLRSSADVHADDETGRLARAFNSMLSNLRAREDLLREDHRRQELHGRVHRAFELADDEPAALDIIKRSLGDILGPRSAELLLADNSKANLEQATVSGDDPNGPGCPVSSPFSCVAVRSGSAMTFETSEALDACPQLRGRGGSPCSAVCVPVTFMGRAIGVLHSTAAAGDVPTKPEIDALSMLSSQAGARIGMLRTMAKTTLQASTDPLTGMMNRRTFQGRTRALRRDGIPFALVMADLDHFKRLNDTHGHETGDRALKTFCEVISATTRSDDVLARWGGEEFAFAFPNLTAEQTVEVLMRVRVNLAGRLATSDMPGFTASYGVVDVSQCATIEDAIRLADDALYESKGEGRDRATIATVPISGSGVGTPVATRKPRIAEPVQNGALMDALALANSED